MITKLQKRISRKKRVRAKINGNKECPRLSVFKSATNIYAQIIDDEKGETLASASSLKMKGKVGHNAKEVGKLISEEAQKKGVKKVVFDRSGYLYTGNVKILAESAREHGLKF